MCDVLCHLLRGSSALTSQCMENDPMSLESGEASGDSQGWAWEVQGIEVWSYGEEICLHRSIACSFNGEVPLGIRRESFRGAVNVIFGCCGIRQGLHGLVRLLERGTQGFRDFYWSFWEQMECPSCKDEQCPEEQIVMCSA